MPWIDAHKFSSNTIVKGHLYTHEAITEVLNFGIPVPEVQQDVATPPPRHTGQLLGSSCPYREASIYLDTQLYRPASLFAEVRSRYSRWRYVNRPTLHRLRCRLVSITRATSLHAPGPVFCWRDGAAYMLDKIRTILSPRVGPRIVGTLSVIVRVYRHVL